MAGISRELQEAVSKAFFMNPKFPIADEPPIETMAMPVVIESACPGWQPADRYPAVPCSVDDQVREIVESIEAGAAAIHVHPRDPKTCRNPFSVPLTTEVLDRVFDEVGDCVTLQHTWMIDPDTKVVDYTRHTEEFLELGNGNKYCQGSVVLPADHISMSGGLFTAEATWEGVGYLESHGVKPVYQLYDTYTHFDLLQYGIRSEVSKDRPYLLNLHLGKHTSHSIHRDPWSHLQLITNYRMVDETIPKSRIGVYPGGRNWLPILVTGLMLGAPLVRVGIEDCYWLWPHRDEVIKKNSDVVKMTVELCHLLGRQVVTDPGEARTHLGLRLTS